MRREFGQAHGFQVMQQVGLQSCFTKRQLASMRSAAGRQWRRRRQAVAAVAVLLFLQPAPHSACLSLPTAIRTCVGPAQALRTKFFGCFHSRTTPLLPQNQIWLRWHVAGR